MHIGKGQLRKAVEGRKLLLIQNLIHQGVYSMEDFRHLQDYTLTELESEWKSNQGDLGAFPELNI